MKQKIKKRKKWLWQALIFKCQIQFFNIHFVPVFAYEILCFISDLRVHHFSFIWIKQNFGQRFVFKMAEVTLSFILQVTSVYLCLNNAIGTSDSTIFVILISFHILIYFGIFTLHGFWWWIKWCIFQPNRLTYWPSTSVQRKTILL